MMDPPKFKCDTCSRRYFEPLKLKQHYSDAHDETETIQCEKCDFVAVHENTLKRHLINMHKKNSVKKPPPKPQNSASKSKMKYQTLKSDDSEKSNIPLRRSNRNRKKE